MRQFQKHWATLGTYLEEKYLPSPVDGLEIFGKLLINSYSICDDDELAIGTGLYIGPSILDHSCTPNAVPVFEGTKLTVRAVEDIKCDSTDKIQISYIDVRELRWERIRQLEEQYYFTCNCTLCSGNAVSLRLH